MREIPKPGERYRHFKNKEYQILAVATHSETGEKMVVYQALYGEYGIWVRPLSMFMEEVDRVKYPEAAQRYRFERIAAGPWENLKQQEIRTTRTTHVVNEGVRRSKMSDAATHSWDIPQEEPELHPLVAECLDQETTEGRLEVLQRMSGKVDKRDLDSLCFCLDMNPVGGSVEEELDAIRQCIRMQQRYDAPRLRYGK